MVPVEPPTPLSPISGHSLSAKNTKRDWNGNILFHTWYDTDIDADIDTGTDTDTDTYTVTYIDTDTNIDTD